MRADVIGYASRNCFIVPGRGDRRSAERKETRRKTHQRMPGPEGICDGFRRVAADRGRGGDSRVLVFIFAVREANRRVALASQELLRQTEPVRMA